MVETGLKPNEFSRDERLLRSVQFRRATRFGNASKSPNFKVFVRDNPSPDRRIGLTVSKKVGSAVARNRLKRRIREYFRLNKSSFPRADIVIVAYRGAAELDHKSVANQMSQALRHFVGK